MALRSQIGSSLVAKANPASPIRKTEESKIANPAIPGKGESGSLARKFVEQPFLKPIPEGSARTVSVTPSIDSEAIGRPNMPMPEEGVGMMAGGQPQGQLRSGANNQALFQGGASAPSPATQAAPTARGGVAAKAGSVLGANKGAINPSGQILPEAASTYQASPGEEGRLGLLPSAFSSFSGHVSAGGENPNVLTNKGTGSTGVTVNRNTGQVKSFTPTAGQFIAGGVGKAINKIAPNSSIGKQLQTFGGAAQPAAQGKGSISTGLRSIVQTVNNALNKLRSLFKR